MRIIIILAVLFCYMSFSRDDYPVQKQSKIKENQQAYDDSVYCNRFNLNDCFNWHPGEERLGSYGEFLTYKKIVATCGQGDSYFKILCNVYLPTRKGSTEIDLILIHETGIYVFESKNYSGWIFGSEKQKNWVQTINRNTKTHFYNPIRQNSGHISALKSIIGSNLNYISFIVFSERCELKKVPDDIPGRILIRRQNLERVLAAEFSKNLRIVPRLSSIQIDNLFEKLSPFANVSENKKQMHIQQIKAKSNIDFVDESDLPF